MRAFYTRRFLKHYAKAPLAVQRATDRRIALLVQNLRHPSLRAKKYDEAKGALKAMLTLPRVDDVVIRSWIDDAQKRLAAMK